jgi:ATP-dependent Clp protease ATP-binding subunit ClpA
MFERFTERARQVVVLAQEESRLLKHNYIGTEHILLGLLRERDGLAAQALESPPFEIDIRQVRAQIVRLVGTGEERSPGQIPFTRPAKRTLELAKRESVSLGDIYIGTEHILLGLVRESKGTGARVLRDFDADSQEVRAAVTRMLSDPEVRRNRTPRTRKREQSVSPLIQLQDWYERRCDGEWEQTHSIAIDTLETAGWSVRIGLDGTELAGKTFEEIEIERGEDDWVVCGVEGGQFNATCGPRNLDEALELFLGWAA